MKQKYYNSEGLEIPITDEIKLAFYFIEYPIKKDWMKNMSGDLFDYFVAKEIYKKLSKILKDQDINVLATALLGVENG